MLRVKAIYPGNYVVGEQGNLREQLTCAMVTPSSLPLEFIIDDDEYKGPSRKISLTIYDDGRVKLEIISIISGSSSIDELLK